MTRIAGTLPVPQVANIVAGGLTPMLPRAALARIGYALILYANAALQAAMLATKDVLAHLREQGSLAGIEDRLMGFDERQETVGKSAWDALERRHKRDDP